MKVTEDVYCLESTQHSHVYLIKVDGNILIDTGMPGQARKILQELRGLGVSPESIQTILLTHHDIDHIGNARQLQEATGAEVWASKEDIPYILGEKNRPGVKRVIQTIMRPQKPVLSGSYSASQRFGKVNAISAPGHTPGHTIFQYRNVIFIGDLFKVINGQFQLMPKFFNWNQVEVKKSISLLKNMDFEWICPSHGEPMQNSQMMKDFLSQYGNKI